ncbi:EscU/YscU/HrcU family type III secretion system export apparatus switch protein [Occultella glacieicola]|uniref:EscU/YscU/HrcU family type III secretion system export apparatus switch protein n=1 Tax=Occultella glacieicola TaxID=2518684 RepID=A0ABY2EA79_9MICO|nr:EscU/YscU/HrcU family type III secretion system export apparatus switch protein [Occultella glacieicola]TDE98653.1 EscU/YscU/HrcU family type III secretion system export apparatus switch protein [Occultella glacieicola]
MAESGGQERSEKATDKRMKEVRGDGSLAKSQDLSAWLGIGAGALVLPWTLTLGAEAAEHQVNAVERIIATPDPAIAVAALSEGLGTVLPTLFPVLAATLVAAVAGAVAQGGIHRKKFKVSVESLNLVSGLKRTFGPQALWNGVKAALKTAVVAVVLVVSVQSLMPVLLSSGGLSLSALLSAAGSGVSSLLRVAVVAGLALAALDVFIIIRRNRKKTRMTKREVKDENKQTDGDPLIKGAIRSRQLAMSRNRMIAAIADADVVVVNPTHVAVALRYEPGRSAPRVVAKGSGHVATRIREQAAADGVPMVADVPLARALHAACRLGEEIPVDLYDAVAAILAFVMSLKRRGSVPPGAVHTMPRPASGSGSVARPAARSAPRTAQPAATQSLPA